LGTNYNCVILNGADADFPSTGTPNAGFYVNPMRGLPLGLGVGVVKYDSGELVYSTD